MRQAIYLVGRHRPVLSLRAARLGFCACYKKFDRSILIGLRMMQENDRHACAAHGLGQARIPCDAQKRLGEFCNQLAKLNKT